MFTDFLFEHSVLAHEGLHPDESITQLPANFLLQFQTLYSLIVEASLITGSLHLTIKYGFKVIISLSYSPTQYIIIIVLENSLKTAKK